MIFYSPDISLPRYVLDEDESRHATKVLRLGVGDVVSLVDGRGGLYAARIVALGKRCEVEVESVEKGVGDMGYGLTMAIAPTKNIDRMEWFVEKAVEIGVTRIVPLLCEHSERRVLRPERLEKIMIGAMKQSQRAYMPELLPLTPFSEFVSQPFSGARLIAHCSTESSRKYISDCVGRGDGVIVLIGPEGDFSVPEIAAACASGFVEISLGPQRLRTETAALVAVAEIAAINRG